MHCNSLFSFYFPDDREQVFELIEIIHDGDHIVDDGAACREDTGHIVQHPANVLLAILHGMAGAVRGTGRSVPPMVVLLISLCLFRVVWIQFVLPFFAGIEGVFVLYPVSWALGAVLMALYAWKGSWMTYEHS